MIRQALVDTFGEDFTSLSEQVQRMLIQDVHAVRREIGSDEVSEHQAAVELRVRLGGRHNLASYADCLARH